MYSFSLKPQTMSESMEGMNKTTTEPKLAQILNVLESNIKEARELSVAFEHKSRALLDDHAVSGEETKEDPLPGGALPILQKLVYELGSINEKNRHTLNQFNELV